MKFNINVTNKKDNPAFTQADVESIQIPESQEKVDYASKENDEVALLGKNVNSISNEGNTAFNLKYIPREKIQFNPNNDFDVDNIDELAKSLLSIGMQHNLSAFYDDEQDRYILESGERRLRACDQLFDKYSLIEGQKDNLSEDEKREYLLYKVNIQPFFEKGFPVNVKKAKYQDEKDENRKIDSIESELRKYKVNIDVRELSPQDRAGYIEKVRTLMNERNKLLYGEDAVEPTKAEIAEAVGTSERQLRKYDAIGRLIPALREEFNAGNISINRIPGIASLPEEEQMVFLDLLQKGKTVEPAQVKAYQEHMEAAEKARREAETEKEQLETELEHIRTTKDDEIRGILEESKRREAEIKTQIEKAVKEQNESLIMRLQNDLAKERESSGRLIAEANKSLERTKQALDNANKRIEEMANSNNSVEKSMKKRAEIEVQLSLFSQVTEKLMRLISDYREVSSPEAVKDIADKIKGMEELNRLLSSF